MDKIRVDGSNGVRFSLNRPKGGFTSGAASPFSTSLMSSASESLKRVPKSGINPNKAVFTVDSKTSQILIVNNNACQLLGYSSRALCSMQFIDLLSNKNNSHMSALAEGELNSEDGTIVLLSGKVVEMNNKFGNKVAVSLWIRQIDSDGRCLAVAEPVERRISQIFIDQNGFIVNADYEAVMLFQFESQDQLTGMQISSLIPAIVLPDIDNNTIEKSVRKQKATGKTIEGVSFPLCLLITNNELEADRVSNGHSNDMWYLITIWVFQNLSGLIVIDDYGRIESCNHHFSMLMFGFAQKKILGERITKLIHNFGEELDYLGYMRSRNITQSSLDNEESDTETDPVLKDSNNINPFYGRNIKISDNDVVQTSSEGTQNVHYITNECYVDAQEELGENSVLRAQKYCGQYESRLAVRHSIPEEMWGINENAEKLNNQHHHPSYFNNPIIVNDSSTSEYQNISGSDLLTPVNDSISLCCLSPQKVSSSAQTYTPDSTDTGIQDYSKQFPCADINLSKIEKNINDCTLVPTILAPKRRIKNPQINSPVRKEVVYVDGRYKGEATHCDGNIFPCVYTISSHTLPCSRKVFCVWICRDPDLVYGIDDEARQQNLTLTFNSFTSTVENSLGQAIKYTAAQNSSRPNSVSLMSQCEEEQVSGDFNKYYTTLKQIGKGAYGYVKMAYKNSDRLLVVAKFILKEKLCPQFMIMTEDEKEIPMEIYLLKTIKHPNIVTVYDIFENEKFFQLVMEKHGSGMDLFEFIDRRPMIDEKLGCFIFRQIANAVSYLHSLNILHRDIKDENIIIDQNFHVKLIDFGSATFKKEGQLFSTFFGTTEYCSPEVLAGNKYAGPELEMWSLGVTLYVLMFFENPFIDVEETLRADLVIQHKVSSGLEVLLKRMLDKDPSTRLTMPQLLMDSWINQEIKSAQFNFAWIVPCEHYEANPEKYYTGQIYSSATALSTMSAQDSLSLVDEDSMVEIDEVYNDEGHEDGTISLQSQEQIFNAFGKFIFFGK